MFVFLCCATQEEEEENEEDGENAGASEGTGTVDVPPGADEA